MKQGIVRMIEAARARGVSEEGILSSIVAVIAECTAEILDAAEADRNAARRAK